ncbi:5-hydroxytryptamine receptor 4-like [Gigantopelta aegis]|uniref:5-hydroxytryptamine receptor 4-like n=1 Tax=Gigantopelta aegis TaxID=1735272 RepID=UPI001B888DED|nr:5-hydroxytryptamine receptor 4-like [Gigantopelta aegis]
MDNNNTDHCAEVLAKWPAPPPPLSGAWQYLVNGLLVLLPLLTLLGNSLVILVVIRFKHMRTKAHAFIVSLALADMGVAVGVMPFRAYNHLREFDWVLPRVMCSIVNILDVVLSTASILNLLCLTFDRYLAICRPFVRERIRRRTVTLMFGACWVIPLLAFVVPMTLKLHHSGIRDFVSCSTGCFILMNVPFTLYSMPISFYIPTFLMVGCYWKIYGAAREHRKFKDNFTTNPRDNNSKANRHFRQDLKAAKTIGIVMGCYCVCWFPLFMINLIDPLIGYKAPVILNILADWLGYTNSMMNPVLYYVFSNTFQKAYQLLFKCCWRTKHSHTCAPQASKMFVRHTAEQET